MEKRMPNPAQQSPSKSSTRQEYVERELGHIYISRRANRCHSSFEMTSLITLQEMSPPMSSIANNMILKFSGTIGSLKAATKVAGERWSLGACSF
jgi:hypothetical protein